MDQDNNTNINPNNVSGVAPSIVPEEQEEVRDEIFEAAKKLEEGIDVSHAKFEEESAQSLDKLNKGIVAAENELGDFYEDLDGFVDEKALQAEEAVGKLNEAEPGEEVKELAA